MNKHKSKLIAAFSIMAMILVGAGATLSVKDAVKTEAAYTKLTNVSTITSSKKYVLGVDGSGKGFHYSGTSNWGLVSTTSAPYEYELTVIDATKQEFTAKTIIGSTTYYLTIPTSNTFTMSTSSATLKLGTNSVSGGNIAINHVSTTNRHLRLNGTSGLRSYATATGEVAYFYEIEQVAFGTLASIVVDNPANKTTFSIGETFSSAGLTLTATDTTGKTKTVLTGYSTNYDSTTFTSAHLGTKTVTVSYTEGATKTTTYNIEVIEPVYFTATSVSKFSIGAVYTIVAPDYNVALSDISGNFFTRTSVSISGDPKSFLSHDGVVTFYLREGINAGSSFAFEIIGTANNGKYLSLNSANNYLNVADSISKTSSWTINDTTGITNVERTDRKLQYNANSGQERFACYTGSQKDVVLYVDEATIVATPQYEQTSRIVVNADNAKKVWYKHETFSSEGIVVVAYDDVNGVNKIVESGYTTNYNNVTFNASHFGTNKQVVVTYENKTDNYLIDVFDARAFVKVTSMKQVQVGGSYIIGGEKDENFFALGKHEGNNRTAVSVVKIDDDLYENNEVQVLELHEGDSSVSGSFAFESIGGSKDGMFLAATGTGTQNYLQSQVNITVRGSWVISIEGDVTSVIATEAGTERNIMRYNDTSAVFAAYGSGQLPVSLYVDKSTILSDEYIDAKAFADFVMDLTDAGPITTPDCEDNFLAAWLEWDELSPEAKATFKTHADFTEARQRFTHWAKVNGFNSLDDLDSAGRVTLNTSSSHSMYIVVIVSVLGISTLVGYYFIRKRPKEEIN